MIAAAPTRETFDLEQQWTTLLRAKLAIEVIDDWVIASDSGDWDRFATVWHDDGWMTATWFQGPATELQKARRAGFERGVNIIHFLGATNVDVHGATRDRADEDDDQPTRDGRWGAGRRVCTGRFYDFFDEARGSLGDRTAAADLRKGSARSGRSERQAPARSRVARRFPEGYRHLGYLQTKAGFEVKLGLPGVRGPEVAKLYAEGEAWLDGSERAGEP